MLHTAVHIICICGSVTKDFKRQSKRKQQTACIVLVVPILVRGSETCSLRKRSKNERQSLVRKCQRNLTICTARFTSRLYNGFLKSILSKHWQARRENDKPCKQWSEGQTQM